MVPDMDNDEFRIPDIKREILNDPKKLQEQLSSGKTFQEVLGFTNEAMSQFYLAARRLFEKQKYEEAADAFLFLTTMNPFVYHYWMGLGMSEQLIDEPFAALMAYNMAINIDKTNPIPHYHSASCYAVLHDRQSAMVCLDDAIHAAGDHEHYVEIKKQAQSAKRLYRT